MCRMLSVMLLALVVAGCASTQSSLSKDPRVKEAQERLPFELLVPAYVPTGYEFEGILVNDNPPVGDRVSADLVYSAGDDAHFRITESNYSVHIGGRGVETIQIGTREGEYQEIQRSDDTVRSVAFQATEKVSVSIVTLSLTRDELIKIAASMGK